MSDYKRKVASHKGTLTKIHTQLQNQESIRSDRRDQSTHNHLEDLLQRAEESYATLFNEIEESFPGDGSKQREEVGHYNDFVVSADKARQIINAMKSQRQAYVLYDILTDDIAYWEECSTVDLKASFPKEYASLAKTLDEFRAATSTSGAINIPDLKVRAKELKRRLMKLEQQVSTTDSAGSSDSGVPVPSSDNYYSHDIKARAIPLPVFHGELGDWNTFWTAFNEYIKKVKYVTDRE